MISTPDRRLAVSLIDEARTAGARLKPSCGVLGITARTWQRWTQGGAVRADGRPTAVRPAPSHALTEDERQAVLETTLQPDYAALPPGQIVPRLADEGVYLASESTFYRVLRAHDLQHHRGRAKAPSTPRPPTTHRADLPAAGRPTQPGVVLGHHLAARTDPRAVHLPVPDPRPVQPQERRLGSA